MGVDYQAAGGDPGCGRRAWRELPVRLAGFPVVKRRCGIPAFVTIHETRFQKYVEKPLPRPGLCWLLRDVDHIFANSIPQTLAVSSVTDPAKVESHVNVCDTRVFRRVAPALSNRGKKILPCFARLIPKKGVRYAIKALPIVLKQCQLISESSARAHCDPSWSSQCGALGR